MSMALPKAIELGIVQEGDYFLCKFPHNEVILTRNDTGCRKEQIIHTEDLDMQLSIIKDLFYLISSNATEKHLRLEGREGVAKRGKTMKYVAEQLYKLPEIFLDVFMINGQIQKGMKAAQARISRWYWLDEEYSFRRTGYYEKGIWYMENGKWMSAKLEFGNKSDNWASMSMRIGGMLRPNLKIVGGKGTQKEPWILSEDSESE